MAISYTKKQRDIAKEEDLGLVTISYEDRNSHPEGVRYAFQGPAGTKLIAYMKRAAGTASRKHAEDFGFTPLY